MILADIRSYLQQQHRATLNELSIHFHVEADALRGMLGKWISKGKIRKILPQNSNCGTTCCKCEATLTEIYEWIE